MMFYLYQSIKNLFKHKHKWEVTHTNSFGSATRKTCHCGCVASVEGFYTGKVFKDWWWCCSDGTAWPVEGWGLLAESKTKQDALFFSKHMGTH